MKKPKIKAVKAWAIIRQKDNAICKTREKEMAIYFKEEAAQEVRDLEYPYSQFVVVPALITSLPVSRQGKKK